MIQVFLQNIEGERHLRIIQQRDDGQYMLNHSGKWVYAARLDSGAFAVPLFCDFIEGKHWTEGDFVFESPKLSPPSTELST